MGMGSPLGAAEKLRALTLAPKIVGPLLHIDATKGVPNL